MTWCHSDSYPRCCLIHTWHITENFSAKPFISSFCQSLNMESRFFLYHLGQVTTGRAYCLYMAETLLLSSDYCFSSCATRAETIVESKNTLFGAHTLFCTDGMLEGSGNREVWQIREGNWVFKLMQADEGTMDQERVYLGPLKSSWQFEASFTGSWVTAVPLECTT